MVRDEDIGFMDRSSSMKFKTSYKIFETQNNGRIHSSNKINQIVLKKNCLKELLARNKTLQFANKENASLIHTEIFGLNRIPS